MTERPAGGLAARAAAEWRRANDRSRRALLAGVAALLVTGVPVVGFLVAVVALRIASRARRAATGEDEEGREDWTGEIPRIATLGFLLALLATLLSGVFSAAFVALLQVS